MQLPKIKQELVDGYAQTCATYPGSSSSFCLVTREICERKVITELDCQGNVGIYQVDEGDREMGWRGGIFLAEEMDRLYRV